MNEKRTSCPFTKRELELLEHEARFSSTNKQKADAFFLSDKTIKTRTGVINNKMRKFGLLGEGKTTGLATAVVLCVNEGWINVGDIKMNRGNTFNLPTQTSGDVPVILPMPQTGANIR